ncbi:MAG: hypothetical protein HKO04_05025 [Silicimonas sp.]|nr:hypothetical protein [Silicimonas sp.]
MARRPRSLPDTGARIAVGDHAALPTLSRRILPDRAFDRMLMSRIK